MVLGTEDIEMKEPLKGMSGRRERRVRGLIGAQKRSQCLCFYILGGGMDCQHCREELHP